MKKRLTALLLCCLAVVLTLGTSALAATAVSSIKMKLNAPVVGECADFAPLFDGTVGVDSTTVKWYDITDGDSELGEDTEIKSGHSYRVEIAVESNFSYEIAEGVTGSINGISCANVYVSGSKAQLVGEFEAAEATKVTSLEYALSGYEEGETVGETALTQGAGNVGTVWGNGEYRSYFYLTASGATLDNMSDYSYNAAETINASSCYYLAIKIEAEYGYDISGLETDDIKLTSHNITAQTLFDDPDDGSVRYAIFKLPLFGTEIDSIAITMTTPEQGEYLDFAATATATPTGSASVCDIADRVWYHINKTYYPLAQDENDWYTVTSSDGRYLIGGDDYFYFELSLAPKKGYVITDSTKISFNGTTAVNIFGHKGESGTVYAGAFFSPYKDETTRELSFYKTVALGGNTAPDTVTFGLEIVDMNHGDVSAEDITFNASVKTRGSGDFIGTLKVTGSKTDVESMFTTGFFVAESKGDDKGWAYSDAVWYLCSGETEDDADKIFIYPATLKEDKDGKYYDIDWDHAAEKMEFTNTYTKNTDKAAGDTPGMDDGTDTALWACLALVSAAALGTVVYRRRRSR